MVIEVLLVLFAHSIVLLAALPVSDGRISMLSVTVPDAP
jgi:hypothetical protein